MTAEPRVKWRRTPRGEYVSPTVNGLKIVIRRLSEGWGWSVSTADADGQSEIRRVTTTRLVTSKAEGAEILARAVKGSW